MFLTVKLIEAYATSVFSIHDAMCVGQHLQFMRSYGAANLLVLNLTLGRSTYHFLFPLINPLVWGFFIYF